MLRLTIRSQDASETVLQVDGWVADEDVALLAAEGDRVLAAGRRLVLELGGVMFVDAAGSVLTSTANTRLRGWSVSGSTVTAPADIGFPSSWSRKSAAVRPGTGMPSPSTTAM